jgi:precorrin-6y C5,15-methyltransferase (decarboxylating) CbiE subunit
VSYIGDYNRCIMGKVFAVGVGPGSPKYVTDIVKDIIINSEIVIGYKYTLKTIEEFLKNKEVHEITMQDQEGIYQKIAKSLGSKTCVVPFTGDVNFSESEVVDRLIEIFGDVQIIPGISSIQVAAAKAKVPLDKSKVITMHVSTSIEEKKLELQKALIDGYSVILVPRPWPKEPSKHFMQSEIAIYLKNHGFDTSSIKVHVFEFLTTEKETTFVGMVKDLEGKQFSDLSVMVFDQTKLESYINLK